MKFTVMPLLSYSSVLCRRQADDKVKVQMENGMVTVSAILTSAMATSTSTQYNMSFLSSAKVCTSQLLFQNHRIKNFLGSEPSGFTIDRPGEKK